MGWIISSFPYFSDSRQSQIQDYVINNIEELLQANDDASKYGNDSLFFFFGGDYFNSTYLYRQALDTINYLQKGFRKL